jgi:hypothetical protein
VADIAVELLRLLNPLISGGLNRRNHAKVSGDDSCSRTSLFFRVIIVFRRGGLGAAGPKSVGYAKNEQICRYVNVMSRAIRF